MLLLATALAVCTSALTVGIDLGTTNSAIAVLRQGRPVVVPNRRGELTTPSVVAFTDSGVLVGAEALEQSRSNVANTVVAAKRFIGRTFRACRADARSAGFDVRKAAEGGGVVFNLPAEPTPILPQEVSAALLLQLLADAERATGAAPTAAVITVPAHFDDAQREATRTAAALAGLAEVTLLEEPVAAALAYGLSGKPGTALVLDLGAGTFDVSVLQLTPAEAADELMRVEVVATAGDAHLGGHDLDVALTSHLCDEAEARGLAPRANPVAVRRLAEVAEDAKKRLSVVKRVEIELRGEAEGEAERERGAAEGCTYSLSRETLEVLGDPLLRRMREPLYQLALSARIALPGELEPPRPARKPKAKVRAKEAALRPAGKQKHLPKGTPVDEVLLVGGGTHIVAVRKLVGTLLGVDPRRTVDPMQAVALGAAVHAGVLSGELRGGRVLAAWQAKLGAMMGGQMGGRRGATPGADARDPEREGDAGTAGGDRDDGGSGGDDEESDDEEEAVAEFYRQLRAEEQADLASRSGSQL